MKDNSGSRIIPASAVLLCPGPVPAGSVQGSTGNEYVI